MNSMKRQKDMKLKDEPTRSVGTQCANGKEWRNSSKKNEEAEPQWKGHQLWICLVVKDFPDSSAGKESACSVGHLGSIPGLGRSPGEGKGYPFQYSSLENSMDCVVHGVAKSQT